MIQINLLPEEYRKKRRTPVKKLAIVAVAVSVNASLLAWWCWLAYGVSTGVVMERDLRRDEMDRLRPQVAYHRNLEKETRAYQSRESTLSAITTERVSWTRKLDELIDLVHSGGTGDEPYLIWLDSLDVEQSTDARRQNYGQLRASGHSGFGKFENVSTFLEDARNHRFGGVFAAPAPPKATKAPEDPTLSPSEYWNFTLEVELLPPDERADPEAEDEAEAEAEAAQDEEVDSDV